MNDIAKELVRIAKDLIAKESNLQEANSYYKVMEPFKVFVLTGHSKSNVSYGNTMFLRPKYTPTTAKSGDEIRNLHGGLFFVRAGKMWSCVMEIPDFAPLERGSGFTYEKFPLEKLSLITDGSQQNARVVKV